MRVATSGVLDVSILSTTTSSWSWQPAATKVFEVRMLHICLDLDLLVSDTGSCDVYAPERPRHRGRGS